MHLQQQHNNNNIITTTTTTTLQVPVGGEEHGVKFSKSDETAWVPSQNQEDQVDGPSTSTSENGNGNGMISASASTSEEDTRGYQLMVCYPQKLVFEVRVYLYTVGVLFHLECCIRQL